MKKLLCLVLTLCMILSLGMITASADGAGGTQYPNPLQDVRVRQALWYAIDMDAIVDALWNGTVTAAHKSLVPEGYWQADGLTEYTYNPEKAKELLAQGLSELGLSDPSDVSITILASNTDEFIAVSGAIQQLLQENLGIKVEVETTDSSALRTRRNAYEYDVVLQSWGADWDDATNFLGGYEHDASANPALFINEEFNDTYHKATYSTDLTERIKLLGKAEAILLEEEGITPLYYTGQYYAVSNRLKGVLRRAVVPYLDLYFAEVQ